MLGREAALHLDNGTFRSAQGDKAGGFEMTSKSQPCAPAPPQRYASPRDVPIQRPNTVWKCERALTLCTALPGLVYDRRGHDRSWCAHPPIVIRSFIAVVSTTDRADGAHAADSPQPQVALVMRVLYSMQHTSSWSSMPKMSSDCRWTCRRRTCRSIEAWWARLARSLCRGNVHLCEEQTPCLGSCG
jgi:hypothetical protein